MEDKDNYCIEEDNILSDYLSNCKFDEEKHRLNLPDENEIPEGFKLLFFREAEEKMYEATMNEERFTVIVLDENGWDSDTAERRKQKQVCVYSRYDKQKVFQNYSFLFWGKVLHA